MLEIFSSSQNKRKEPCLLPLGGDSGADDVVGEADPGRRADLPGKQQEIMAGIGNRKTGKKTGKVRKIGNRKKTEKQGAAIKSSVERSV